MGAWTLRAVVLAWAVAVTLSQSSIVSGAELSLARRFARGDLALLVVRLTQGNASAVELASAKFCVQTDFLAQLTLPGSWSGFFSLPGVQVSVGLLWNRSGSNVTLTETSAAPFASSGGTSSVGFFEAWLGLNQGVPEVFVWQTQCNGASVSGLPADQCAPAQCIGSFCGLPATTSRCGSANATSSACDVRLYVAWRGPDRANQLCQSYAQLPANFNLFSTANLVAALTGGVSDFVYGVMNAASGATAAPIVTVVPTSSTSSTTSATSSWSSTVWSTLLGTTTATSTTGSAPTTTSTAAGATTGGATTSDTTTTAGASTTGTTTTLTAVGSTTTTATTTSSPVATTVATTTTTVGSTSTTATTTSSPVATTTSTVATTTTTVGSTSTTATTTSSPVASTTTTSTTVATSQPATTTGP